MQLRYPCEISKDKKLGQVILRCNSPSAFVFGKDLDEAKAEMKNLIIDMVSSDFIAEGKPFPLPENASKKSVVFVELGANASLKILLLNCMVETKTRPIDLAKKLGLARQEISRVLNPRRNTKLETMEKAIEATGRKLVFTIQ